MKQSELTLCANRAADLRHTIRRAKGVVSSERRAIVEAAICEADEIAERLRDLLPEAKR